MTLDELIKALQDLRRKYSGDMEVNVYHLDGERGADLDSPNLYLGRLRGNPDRLPESLLIGHPRNHSEITHWESWMEDILVERYEMVYEGDPDVE